MIYTLERSEDNTGWIAKSYRGSRNTDWITASFGYTEQEAIGRMRENYPQGTRIQFVGYV